MADAYLGEIRVFGGNYAPQDWLVCNGALLKISAYNALFSLIGTTYGGDGVNTFGIPDLRGRLAIGMGQGTNLTNRPLGSVTGAETVTIDASTMPTHTHTVKVSTATTANTSKPVSLQSYIGAVQGAEGQTAVGYLNKSTTGLLIKPMNQKTLTYAGGSEPHNNIMPCVAINYIICVNGLYPPQP